MPSYYLFHLKIAILHTNQKWIAESFKYSSERWVEEDLIAGIMRGSVFFFDIILVHLPININAQQFSISLADRKKTRRQVINKLNRLNYMNRAAGISCIRIAINLSSYRLQICRLKVDDRSVYELLLMFGANFAVVKFVSMCHKFLSSISFVLSPRA